MARTNKAKPQKQRHHHIAFCFQDGGALGAYQVHALDEAGYDPKEERDNPELKLCCHAAHQPIFTKRISLCLTVVLFRIIINKGFKRFKKGLGDRI
ncbi:TPA: hypothetical protein ACTXXA_003171 [Legionella anisa]